MISHLLLLSFHLFAQDKIAWQMKTTGELLVEHQHNQKNEILFKRCRVEIENLYLPLHCYEWLSNKNNVEQRKWKVFLQKHCLRSLQNGKGVMSTKLAERIERLLKGECLQKARAKIQDIHYRDMIWPPS